MFKALLDNFKYWEQDDKFFRVLSMHTVDSVYKNVMGRWEGVNSQGHQILVPFKDNIFLAACVFDPYYNPNKLEQNDLDIELGVDWVLSIREVVTKCHVGVDLDNNMNQVYDVVLKQR